MLRQALLITMIFILGPVSVRAQYEYMVPRTQVSIFNGNRQPIFHPYIVFYSSSSGSGRLSNGCGFDTAFSFSANSMVTLKIRFPLGRLFYNEKEKVVPCNLILNTTVPVQATCYLTNSRSNGAYKILEKSEVGTQYHVAYIPFNLASYHRNCLSNKDTADDGINTTISAFENNTKIIIHSPYKSGKGMLDNGSTTITLNRGESFTFQICAINQVFPKMSNMFKSTFPGGFSLKASTVVNPLHYTTSK